MAPGNAQAGKEACLQSYLKVPVLDHVEAMESH